MGIAYADSALLNKGAHAILIKKKISLQKYTFPFIWVRTAGILLQFQPIHYACIGFVHQIKWNELETQFWLVCRVQGTPIEVQKGAIAIGSGGEMGRESTRG